ncbi:branched-chain amino acid aminotransferase [bacterium BMS3Abin03]|jgi:branched-chain amino acid aminotransferase|nr:branched-chain amino acid aminotransferase [bacterium BMS3Abin03]MCG6959846.1 branched-chain amino acid aminotransferase [bacterium BMS3Abin03]
MEAINYQVKERNEEIKLPESLGFGKYFTDHVFEMDYSKEKGWYNPTIKPLADILMHPATMFIHYGQAIFEGLKAFKTENGDVVLFRPDQHIKRLNNSAKRICIPAVDEEFVLEALKELVNIDRDWVPSKKGESLYVRPFVYGSNPFLGVSPANTYKLVILLSPVGAYYPEGFKPVKILVQDDYVRAVRKGLGECKTPANYAASLLAGEKAKEKGFTQVLWLDGVKQKNIEEVGTMNIFINLKDEVVTPKLNGSILPGITRKTVIQLLKEWNMNVVERDISVDEVIQKYDSGELLGIFGTGTAAVITSVGWLSFKDKNMVINGGEPGKLDVKLFDEITAIQYGLKQDTHGWIQKVEKKEVEVS